ncbi:high mobility group B protein 10 isoform X2 [Punica granatum]|uniref:High mobility group B protein 10 isoform X2 n=2 Tax=Punica granatum TaxID=22663 RepID=A0A6P8EQP3_PUNGR|nr:high mobility group B protein 10 isoform X2 [Punica granatum]PKI35704.1 hypothetical protein CRG98_043862 [Punica granatum]
MSMVLHQLGTESPDGQFSAPPAGASRAYPPATADYKDVVQSPEVFEEKLSAFHSAYGSKFKVPTVGGKALDLHRLFVEVTSRGGIEKVTRDRRWKEVIFGFSFPSTITSASFVLRKYYMSMLYHFEQVYFFRKGVPPISMPDCGIESLVNGSASQDEGAYTNNSSGHESNLHPGSSVTGFIDGKFDNGYLVTVKLGAQELKGVLYHIPPILHMSQSAATHSALVPSRRNRKRSRLALRDPARPKSNKSGYNFFFSENYARLRPQYYGQERAITKKIGYLWSNLTEAEKQVYQEKGLRDKERYKSEMLEYQSSKI